MYNRHHGDAPTDAVYIGRGTPWGNPYKVGEHGVRGECVDLFEQHVLPSLDVEPLRGKALVCSCYPSRCHGDSIINKLYGDLMSEVSGVIQEIQTRSVANGKTAYNIVVGGQSYGAGLYAPKAKVGDYVKFGVDESRGYKNVERNTLKVGKAPPKEEQDSAPVLQQNKPVYNNFDTRQDAISRQAASNTAIAFLSLLSDNDALGLPASSAKKGSKQEAMEALLHKYEQLFYERNTGVAWKDISPNKTITGESDEEEPEAPEDEAWQ